MNNKNVFIWFFAALILGGWNQALAKENEGVTVKRTIRTQRLMDGCLPATAAVDLDVNNVRARIMNGGDMWWDLVTSPKYEIPKVSAEEVAQGVPRRHSLFAGALWIGGMENNNLRLAAMTYRQDGSDFYPGPLDTVTASITSIDCQRWDKIWEITREEIDAFIVDRSKITDAIRTWPAHGLNGYGSSWGHSNYLAPFEDVDNNGRYEPESGDYPKVYGDQTLWYIYNDKGSIHTETTAEPIGLELQTQAFGFATNDEINNMTFYTTTITNRSRNTLDSTFFGQWADPDLGFYADDYVAVDVPRSLGICYNGDNFDEGVFGYGANPPSVGIDFFKGPLDEDGNPLGMEYFVYYNNDWTVKGNPQQPIHYYYYLTGSWKDGARIKCGGDGRAGSEICSYMFPDDPRAPDPAWSEVTAGNRPGDRRFIQSAGPFSLKPGAKNEVTIGVVWARATTGGATGSFDQLKLADDKAQRLFDNRFELLDGPDAPDVLVRELDRKILLTLVNTSNDRVEKYHDEVVSGSDTIEYNFQGYQIYQLKNAQVTPTEYSNADRARLVAQVDVRDGVGKLVNRIFDPVVSAEVPTLMVDGTDEGIRHTFEITKDYFATGEDRLNNYSFYYYSIVSYANTTNTQEPEPYLQGRRNIEVITAIPHRPFSDGSTIPVSSYGDGVKLTRIEGRGNGGNILDLDSLDELKILENNYLQELSYKVARGPVNITVSDPMTVAAGNFEVKFIDSSLIGKTVTDTTVLNDSTTYWTITNTTTGESITSEFPISVPNEQILYGPRSLPNSGDTIRQWGLSVAVQQPKKPGNNVINDPKNGFLEATMEFQNPQQPWLTGVPDFEDYSNQEATIGRYPMPTNWIRAGKHALDQDFINDYLNDAGEPADPQEVYETLLGGIIAPAGLVARDVTGEGNSLSLGPISSRIPPDMTPLNNLQSVDIVFTSDKSKWSRCIVLEQGPVSILNEGGVEKFKLRKHAGWNMEVDGNGNPVYSTNPADSGRSWFPGYAINLETGERLNIFFAEDSHLPEHNGADMLWNPSSEATNSAVGLFDFASYYTWGGKHWIYVMGSEIPASEYNPNKTYPYVSRYDSCNRLYNMLTDPSIKTSSPTYREAFIPLMWVMLPRVQEGYDLASVKDGIIPNDVRIRLRVSRPYATFDFDDDYKNDGQPYYTFNTDDLVPRRSEDVGKFNFMSYANVTPNPYYARSEYENSQLDNRVRFVNLPKKCEVSIYTLDGQLVRKLTKDESDNLALEGKVVETHQGEYPRSFIDWDLKNTKGVPVASGVYIMHINGFEYGEKVIKWFGVTRPIDLDTF